MFPDDGDDVAAPGGNFHGQPLSLPLDHLALALCELAVVLRAARRTRCSPPATPACRPFLTPRPGLSSGLMIAQYAAAALVNECQVLAHPAGAGSIPTSAGQEDFNSMGALAALKARTVVENAAHVIATELVCAVPGARVPPAAAHARTCSRRRSRACARYVPRVEEDRSLGGRADARWRDALRTGEVVLDVTRACRGWQQEAALRMLENNLHPDVAEKPEELVVYGGIGKAARNHGVPGGDQARADAARRRRDAARAVRQAGRRVRDARGRRRAC